jgi:hypothetical protein
MKIIWTLLLMLSGVALAAEKMMVAYCTKGEGCQFWLSSLNAADSDLLLGTGNLIQQNKNGMIVMVKKGNSFEFEYVDTKRSRKELDRVYGGGGNDEIVLFPWANEIQPQDGRWTVKQGAVSINAGCPKTMRQGLLQGLKTTPPATSGNKTFSQPFKPTDLINTKSVRWVKRGSNQYRALIDLGSSRTMTAFFDFTILAPNKVKAVSTSTIRIPSVGVCTAVSEYTFTRG